MHFHLGVITGSLGAISTVFGTSAGFYGQQCAYLDFLWVMKLPVNSGSLINQVQNRLVVYLADLFSCPVIAYQGHVADDGLVIELSIRKASGLVCPGRILPCSSIHINDSTIPAPLSMLYFLPRQSG